LPPAYQLLLLACNKNKIEKRCDRKLLKRNVQREIRLEKFIIEKVENAIICGKCGNARVSEGMGG